MAEVEFVKDNPPYRTGDRASFPDHRAVVFVEGGVAEYVALPAISKPMEPKQAVVRDFKKKG